MEFEDITTSRYLNCPPQIQPPDQTTPRFIDRFIRLKNRYWNRGFLIVLLTFIGLTIQWFQNQSLTNSLLKSYEERHNIDYIGYGMGIGYISGGVLATIYSAQKTILLFLTFIPIEIIPEITVCFSITNVRKIFSCLYFVSMPIIYYLKAFPDDIFLFLDNKKCVHLVSNFMPYFSLFGFEINYLDIAPQYSSVLYGILMTIYSITWFFSQSILQYSSIFEELNLVQFGILGVVISLAVAVFYAIFASAELQPWAVDKPVKENQRNIQEEVYLTSV